MRAVPIISVTAIPAAMAINRPTASGRVPCNQRKETCVSRVFCRMNTMNATSTTTAVHAPTHATLVRVTGTGRIFGAERAGAGAEGDERAGGAAAAGSACRLVDPLRE